MVKTYYLCSIINQKQKPTVMKASKIKSHILTFWTDNSGVAITDAKATIIADKLEKSKYTFAEVKNYLNYSLGYKMK